MITCLKEIDSFLADEINEAVFQGQMSRPGVGGEILERFRLAKSRKGIAHDRLDQGHGA